jgi:hypothetical protein
MALSFGWRANDVRESIWRDDDALTNVPAAALEAWKEDGDASHLRPYALGGQPTVITFRTLNPDESRIAQAYFYQGDNALESYTRATLICFRIGVDFAGAPDGIGTPDGTIHPRIVKDRGTRMLALEFVAAMEAQHPGIVSFYGGLIYKATWPTEVEKKASSPPSTLTPSSAAVSTTAITEPSPAPGAA